MSSDILCGIFNQRKKKIFVFREIKSIKIMTRRSVGQKSPRRKQQYLHLQHPVQRDFKKFLVVVENHILTLASEISIL